VLLKQAYIRRTRFFKNQLLKLVELEQSLNPHPALGHPTKIRVIKDGALDQAYRVKTASVSYIQGCEIHSCDLPFVTVLRKAFL